MRNINTKRIGNVGENIATEYLKSIGYKILDRNVYIADGELDIVAQDGNTIVFVEVKTRSNSNFGSPLESITKSKINNIIKCAKLYIARKNLQNFNVRFDVVAIDCERIELIKDAFWLN